MQATPRTPEVKPPRRASGKLVFQILLGLAFSGLFVWLAARNVEWESFRDQAAQMQWGYVALYGLILSVAHILRLIRWSMTVRAIAPVPWRRCLSVCAVGMLAVFAMPARLGELVRPLAITRGQDINFGQATATVVVERLVDGLMMSAILFGTVMLLDASLVPQEFIISGYVASGVFGGASVGLLVAALAFRWVEKPLRALLGKISEGLAQRVVGTIEGFFGALRLLGRGGVASVYLLITATVWLLSGLGLWVLLQTLPEVTGGLPLLAAFATLSMLVVGIMIPAGPGTVGVFHWSVVFGLQMFSVEQSAGLLIATTLHLMVALVNLIWGGLGWLSYSVSGSPQREEE